MSDQLNMVCSVSLMGTTSETFDLAPPVKADIRSVIAQQWTHGTTGTGTDNNLSNAPYIDYVEGASPLNINIGNGSIKNVKNQPVVWGSIKLLLVENLGSAFLRVQGAIMQDILADPDAYVHLPVPPTGGKSLCLFMTGRDGLNGWQLTTGTYLQLVSAATVKANVWIAP